jgi:hypothetical protein
MRKKNTWGLKIGIDRVQLLALIYRRLLISFDRHSANGLRGLVAQCASVDLHESHNSTTKLEFVG